MTSRYNKRELADSIKVEKLYKDTFKAGKIVGYKKFYMEELPDNRFDSVSLLDIIKIIEEYIENIKPDIIYTHFGGYLNIYQKITFESVLTTIRPIGNEYVKEIYAFETVSSTEWNFNSTFNFKPNYFIDITETLDEKLKAMECYKSELREFPHPRLNKNLKASALKWGSVISKEYVEAFEVIRIIK